MNKRLQVSFRDTAAYVIGLIAAISMLIFFFFCCSVTFIIDPSQTEFTVREWADGWANIGALLWLAVIVIGLFYWSGSRIVHWIISKQQESRGTDSTGGRS